MVVHHFLLLFAGHLLGDHDFHHHQVVSFLGLIWWQLLNSVIVNFQFIIVLSALRDFHFHIAVECFDLDL